MSGSYKEAFEDWEIGIATRLIRKFQRRWQCLGREDLEDLLQECLCHWHFSKTSYDPKGEASRKTFMARVIENKLMDLVREKETYKRKAGHLTLPLSSPEKDLPPGSKTAKREPLESSSFYPFLQIELKLDLSKALRQLTAPQRALCHLLGEEGLTVKEASFKLAVPRASLYDEIKRIRLIFKRNHLDGYLKDFSDTSRKKSVCTS